MVDTNPGLVRYVAFCRVTGEILTKMLTTPVTLES